MSPKEPLYQWQDGVLDADPSGINQRLEDRRRAILAQENDYSAGDWNDQEVRDDFDSMPALTIEVMVAQRETMLTQEPDYSPAAEIWSDQIFFRDSESDTHLIMNSFLVDDNTTSLDHQENDFSWDDWSDDVVLEGFDNPTLAADRGSDNPAHQNIADLNSPQSNRIVPNNKLGILSNIISRSNTDFNSSAPSSVGIRSIPSTSASTTHPAPAVNTNMPRQLGNPGRYSRRSLGSSFHPSHSSITTMPNIRASFRSPINDMANPSNPTGNSRIGSPSLINLPTTHSSGIQNNTSLKLTLSTTSNVSGSSSVQILPANWMSNSSSNSAHYTPNTAPSAGSGNYTSSIMNSHGENDPHALHGQPQQVHPSPAQPTGHLEPIVPTAICEGPGGRGGCSALV